MRRLNEVGGLTKYYLFRVQVGEKIKAQKWPS